MVLLRRSILVAQIASVCCLVGVIVFVSRCAWQEMDKYGSLPARPDIARAFALTADQGQSFVTLPNDGGVFLLAAPYVLTEDYLIKKLAIDPTHAARVCFANTAVESMHIFHIDDGRCAGHCVLESRFDFRSSAFVVPAGGSVQLTGVDAERFFLIQPVDAIAPPVESAAPGP